MEPLSSVPAPPGRQQPSSEQSEPAPSAPERPAQPTPDLPPIAAKADDLEAIKTAVEDAASVGGALWLSYLFVLFYLAVAAGAVTHADLFFENPVKLPFLNIELPLLAFFFLAPILFLVVHAYALVHLAMLSDKAKRFHQALHDKKRDINRLPKTESAAIRVGLQWQLPSNIFVQFLAGPPDTREGLFGSLLRGIAWSTLVVAPVLLLLLLQIQFLPFHSSLITWTHRIALLADMVLLWWLWRKILSGRAADLRRGLASWVWTGLGLALSACAVLFSWTAATFPGEWQEDHLANRAGLRGANSLHDLIFNLPVDPTTRHRRLPFSSTLVLSGLNIYEGLRIDDPEKAKWRDYVFLARGRDLNGAILDLANLQKVDFEGAYLRGASLDGAQLQGASFNGAQLQGATLREAQLQGATLNFAQLQDSTLNGARLRGATLDHAELQGATLDHAELQGATLESAQLQGASLYGAQLQGAKLNNASFRAPRSIARSFRAPRSIARSFRAPRSIARNFRARRSASVAQAYGASLASYATSGRVVARCGPGRNRSSRCASSGASDFGPPDDLAELVAVMLVDANSRPDQFQPVWRNDKGETQPWNDKAYQDLRKMMESLPAGALRDRALQNIASLDCANPDRTIASCDPSLPPPPEATHGERHRKATASTTRLMPRRWRRY